MDARWEDIDQSEFATLTVSERWLQDLRDEVTQHLQALLAGTKSFLRNDYREVAQLSLVLLGVSPSQPRFCRPGAYSNARWMAKVSTAKAARVMAIFI